MEKTEEKLNGSTHTISLLVENKPGVLHRIGGLFSRRGYNIASLTVGPTVHPEYSRMTIVVRLSSFVDKLEYGRSRDEVYDDLKSHQFLTRRYFFPLISQFPMYKGLDSARPEKLPVAEGGAQKVLCLPMYPDLNHKQALKIVDLIRQ